MAERILRYTQCNTNPTNYTVPSTIVIKDYKGNITQSNTIPLGYTGTLSVSTSTGTWDHLWTLRNTTTGETLSGTSSTYPLGTLSCGTWINTVEIIDPATKQVVSTASNTITIECADTKTRPQLGLSITANPLTAPMNTPIEFTSLVSGGSGSLVYRWDYGDGNTSTASGKTTHTYTKDGSYTVTLIVTDTDGNVARSSMVVVITSDGDTDQDGVKDTDDICPLVYAKTPSGCPPIDTYR